MEFFYVCLILSLFALLLSFSLPFLYQKKPAASSGHLPPGRTGFPVIGESYAFLSSGWKGHPDKFIFDRMAKYSSQVFRTHLLGQKAAIFCGAAGNKFLFSNEGKLVKIWWPSFVDKIFPSSTKSSATEEATNLRKLLPNFLKPEALRRYIGTMDEIAKNQFSSNWDKNAEVLVYPLCKQYTLWLAARLFFSIEDSDEVAKFIEPLSAVASGILAVPVDLPGTPFSKAIKASKQMKDQLLGIIRQRKVDLLEGKASVSQDILSHMLSTSDEDGKFMNDIDIADKIMGLLIGGHDTTSSACAFIVKYLAELPEIYEGVYQEQMEIGKTKGPGELLNWEDIKRMKYSWNVACEVLRLSPPLQGGFRQALIDLTINGFSIPKGWKIYWSAHSTHRSPDYFPEPMKFDPSRFQGSGPDPYTFVPFGGGPRMCPGKEYARLEILVFMHNLVNRFKWQKVIADEKIVVDPMPMPAKGLPVRLYPHKP